MDTLLETNSRNGYIRNFKAKLALRKLAPESKSDWSNQPPPHPPTHNIIADRFCNSPSQEEANTLKVIQIDAQRVVLRIANFFRLYRPAFSAAPLTRNVFAQCPVLTTVRLPALLVHPVSLGPAQIHVRALVLPVVLPA